MINWLVLFIFRLVESSVRQGQARHSKGVYQEVPREDPGVQGGRFGGNCREFGAKRTGGTISLRVLRQVKKD